jgi:pyruvyltransferase
MSVEVVHWNPRRPLVGHRLRWGRPVNNFGDLLGPVIVERILAQRGLSDRSTRTRRLLAVGSILRLAGDGDTLWGIGANGKSLTATFPFTHLDVRAVRGPLTREFLDQKGIAAPAIYGDPGLLVGRLWSLDELRRGGPRRQVAIVPNLHDYPKALQMHGNTVVNPTAPLWKVLSAIASSDLVVGSSLHGVVIAESLGIPARLVASQSEPEFKYLDYFQGSGRVVSGACKDIPTAIAAGGGPPIDWNPEPLLEAFPEDLFSR